MQRSSISLYEGARPGRGGVGIHHRAVGGSRERLVRDAVINHLILSRTAKIQILNFAEEGDHKTLDVVIDRPRVFRPEGKFLKKQIGQSETAGTFSVPLLRFSGRPLPPTTSPHFPRPAEKQVDPECRVAEVDQTKPSDHGAAGGQVAHMRYQLPADVTSTRCIMQMVHCEFISCAFFVRQQASRY